MHRIAIWGPPPDGLAAALAARGMTVDAAAPLGIAVDVEPPPGAQAVLIVADLDEASAIRWLDRGADVAPRAIGAPIAAARIDAALRRTLLHVGPLAIDLAARTVTRGGVPVALLSREYQLLVHLARRPGEVVSRAELHRAVWGLSFDPGTNVVAVHVSRLRARLDRDGDRRLIATVPGVGYRLDP